MLISTLPFEQQIYSTCRKINVGTAYQAEVPDFIGVVDAYRDDTRVYDVLVWNPKNIDENDPKMEESCELHHLTYSCLCTSNNPEPFAHAYSVQSHELGTFSGS